jgi:hypothetical protein
MTDQNLDAKLSHAYQSNEALLAMFEQYLKIREQRERDEVTEDGDIDTFDWVAFLISTRRELRELAGKGGAAEERRT